MVLGQRFDTSTRSLDLSDMYHEPGMFTLAAMHVCMYVCNVISLSVFREHGIKASMYNREFVTCVLSLIAQYCPEVSDFAIFNEKC